ncbi:MAG: FlgD immunoglobulin-like domain containing protein, partial [bacterium]
PTLATAVGDDESETPQSFHLSQNYPNPFNPVTTIDYSLSERSHVEIAIFNLLGQKVRTVVDQSKQAGQYQTEWDGRDESGQPVASGVYFSSMKTGNSVTSRKMLLLK